MVHNSAGVHDERRVQLLRSVSLFHVAWAWPRDSPLELAASHSCSFSTVFSGSRRFPRDRPRFTTFYHLQSYLLLPPFYHPIFVSKASKGRKPNSASETPRLALFGEWRATMVMIIR